MLAKDDGGKEPASGVKAIEMGNPHRALKRYLLWGAGLLFLNLLPLAVALDIERQQLQCLDALRDTEAARSDYEAIFGPLEWSKHGENLCSRLDLAPHVDYLICVEQGREKPVSIGVTIADPVSDLNTGARTIFDNTGVSLKGR